MESEIREDKSDFGGTQREWLRLVKTVKAFANTSGGRLYLKEVSIPVSEFDSARLTDRVEKHVGPRVENITTELNVVEDSETYKVVVNVPNSEHKPHIITLEGQYKNHRGDFRYEFHKGQVWVRHSASNAEAGPDDMDRMFRERASALLNQLGAIVMNTSMEVVEQASKVGLGISVTKDGSGIPVQHVLLPYTATSLAKELGVFRRWVSEEANKRGWRRDLNNYDRRYMQKIPNVSGDGVQQWRYSELARHELAIDLNASRDANGHVDARSKSTG